MMGGNITREEHWDFHQYNSVTEFDSFISTLNTHSVFAIFIVWILVLLPLFNGPISIIRSFYFALPTALVLNILLFFRGVAMPDIQLGLGKMFDPDRKLSFLSWYFISSSRFYGDAGILLMLGKFTKVNTNALPKIYVSFGIVFVLMSLNTLKYAGFLGHFEGLFEDNTPQARYSMRHGLTNLAISLTQIPSATFWLFLQFLFLICVRLPTLSFALEMVSSSISESLPHFVEERLKYLSAKMKCPVEFVVPGILGILGFFVTLILVNPDNWKTWVYIHFLLNLSHYSSFIFILCAILPICYLKKFNQGRLDFFSFMSRHNDRRAKILNIGSLIISIILTWVMFIFFCYQYFDFFFIMDEMRNSFFVVLSSFIVGVAVQCILHWRNPIGHPWCLSLGRRLTDDVDDLVVDDGGHQVDLKVDQPSNEDRVDVLHPV